MVPDKTCRWITRLCKLLTARNLAAAGVAEVPNRGRGSRAALAQVGLREPTHPRPDRSAEQRGK